MSGCNQLRLPLNHLGVRPGEWIGDKMPSHKREKIVAILWDKCHGRCAYCWIPFIRHFPTIDHIIPRSRGGLNALSNMTLACAPCNHRKGDLLIVEWIETKWYNEMLDRKCKNAAEFPIGGHIAPNFQRAEFLGELRRGFDY